MFLSFVAVPTKRRQLAPPGMLRSPTDADRNALVNNSLHVPLDPTALPMNGRAKSMSNVITSKIGGNIHRNKMFSWVDAPDDVYFIATDSTK